MLGLPRDSAASEVDQCNTWMRLIQEKLLFGTDEPSTFVYCWPARERRCLRDPWPFKVSRPSFARAGHTLSRGTAEHFYKDQQHLSPSTLRHWFKRLHYMAETLYWKYCPIVKYGFDTVKTHFHLLLWLNSFPFGWRVKSKVKRFYSARLNRWLMLWALKLKY